jgi:hypothetical protein
MKPSQTVKIACLLFAMMVPAVVQAQDAYSTNADGSIYTYSTNADGSANIVAYAGPPWVVNIPTNINGLTVASIGSDTFENISNLTSVTIPNSVTQIGGDAFLLCPDLTSITIPSTVTNFPVFMIVGCSNLLGVYFQGNAPRDAFPAAPPVFQGDPKATLYYLQGTTGWKPMFDLLPTVLWNPQVLDQLIYTTNSGAITITAYVGAGGAVVIPSTINGLPVAGIGSNAFFNSTGLTGITIPNTVTNIGDFAFASCTNLTSITIPNNVTGNGVLSNCTALTNIIILNNVTSIGNSEFSDCTALTSLTIPSSVSNIGDWAFQDCSSLNTVYFNGNAPVADLTVFDGDNNVTNYYLPKTAGWGPTFAGRPTVPILFTYTTNSGAITITKYIGIWGSVLVPDTINDLPVTTIGNVTFNGCASLTNILISSKVTSIAGQAFVGCPNLLAIDVDALNPVYSSVNGVLFDKNQVTLIYYPGGRAGSYSIPNGVTSIPSYAFQSCPSLTGLTVPNSVITIGTLAFNVDPSLTTIYFLGDAPNVNWEAFDIQNTVTVFYLPGTTGWDIFDVNSGFSPAMLWNPQIQTNDGSFGMQANQFGFNIAGSSNLVIVVEAGTSLANPVWIPVATNTLTGGSSYFFDSQWTNYPSRFYRLSMP